MIWNVDSSHIQWDVQWCHWHPQLLPVTSFQLSFNYRMSSLCRQEGCKMLCWVCLSICLSACVSHKPHGRISPNLSRMLITAVLSLPIMWYVMQFRFCKWRHIFIQWTLWHVMNIHKRQWLAHWGKVCCLQLPCLQLYSSMPVNVSTVARKIHPDRLHGKILQWSDVYWDTNQ